MKEELYLRKKNLIQIGHVVLEKSANEVITSVTQRELEASRVISLSQIDEKCFFSFDFPVYFADLDVHRGGTSPLRK